MSARSGPLVRAVVLVTGLVALSMAMPATSSADDRPASDDGLTEYTDTARTLSVRLPAGYESEPLDEAKWPGLVVNLQGAAEDRPRFRVGLWVRTAHARAGFAVDEALEGLPRDPADTVVSKASLRAGASVRGDHVWVRADEAGGAVYVAEVRSHGTLAAQARPEAVRILDSMKILSPRKPPAPGSGATPYQRSGYQAWMFPDSLVRPRKRLDLAIDELAKGRDEVQKLLGGAKAWDAGRTVVRFGPDRAIAWEIRSRLITVVPSIADPPGPDHRIQLWQAGACAAVWHHFGGNAQGWLAWGLGNLATYRVEAANAAPGTMNFRPYLIGGSRKEVDIPLRRWILEPRGIQPGGHEENVATLWHEFLRSAKAPARAKSAYAASLAALRESGDPAEFRKAWDGVDLDAVEAAFRAWSPRD